MREHYFIAIFLLSLHQFKTYTIIIMVIVRRRLAGYHGVT